VEWREEGGGEDDGSVREFCRGKVKVSSSSSRNRSSTLVVVVGLTVVVDVVNVVVVELVAECLVALAAAVVAVVAVVEVLVVVIVYAVVVVVLCYRSSSKSSPIKNKPCSSTHECSISRLNQSSSLKITPKTSNLSLTSLLCKTPEAFTTNRIPSSALVHITYRATPFFQPT
jgi:uncharacterized membrane protein